MEGAMFYWILWSFWIYLTFILNKHHPDRTKVSAVLLIVIILADIHVQLGGVEFYAGGFFLLILSYTTMNGKKAKAVVYFFICSFIVMLAYVAFLLFEIFDPAWLIFKREWIIGVCLGYLVSLLQKTLAGRLAAIISGTMQGEILYAFILSKFNFHYPIGAPGYLDAWALTSGLLVAWSMLESAGTFIGLHFQSVHRSRQKSS